MLTQIKNTIINIYDSSVAVHRSKSEANYDRRNLRLYLDNELSKEEKQLIRSKWGGLIKNIPRGYDFYRGIKSLYGFNPDFLPSSYFFPYIEQILNPIKWKYNLGHKSLIELAYNVGIRHPHTIIRSFGGVYLDEHFKPLLLNEVIDLIKKNDSPLLYKPSTNSEQGAGIRLISPDEFNKLIVEIKTGQIFSKNADFVIQVPVEQSLETLLFNPTSLNCMRVTTYNINNRISVGSRAIKCGPKDSVVDNIGSGKRGVIVGIHPNGTLNSFGFYGNGEKTTSHNGVEFDGKLITSFHLVEEAAVHLHEYVHTCKIIGWDIALDAKNNPVLIEGNTVYPGISFEQMCSGPIFGDRTNEVIEYISSVQKRENNL